MSLKLQLVCLAIIVGMGLLLGMARDSLSEEARPSCLKPADLRREFTARYPEARLTQHDAARYMQALNSLPPVSAIPAPETLLVASAPGRPSVLLLAFDKGCLTAMRAALAATHEKVLARIEGAI